MEFYERFVAYGCVHALYARGDCLCVHILECTQAEYTAAA